MKEMSLEDQVNILGYMLYELIEAQRRQKTEEHYKKGSYPFIPMGTRRLLNLFHSIKMQLLEDKRWAPNRRKVHHSSFLDAGCGCGNVVLAAMCSNIFTECHGIEYFSETAKRAKNWLGLDKKRTNKIKIIQDDILTFENYRHYDVIYYYCPFVAHTKEQEFEERLEDEMKVGAVIFGFMKQSYRVRKDRRFERLDGYPADAAYIKIRQ